MKANAPEKIYLCPSDLAGIDYDNEWYGHPFGDSIEYIRTDAFIEKACEWFEQNLHMYNTAEALGDRQCFIEDFRKYMEE